MPAFTVVIPVYNSEKHIVNTFNELRRLPAFLDESSEIIFVDDGSSDSSVSKILQLQQQHAGVFLIRLKKNYGQYAATVCGISRATGRHIITMDADGIPPVSLLAQLTENRRQYNLQYAEPVLEERGAFRKWGSRLFDAIVRVSAGNPSVLPSNRGSSMRMMSAEFTHSALASLTNPVLLDIILMRLAKESIRFVPVPVACSATLSSYSHIKLVLMGVQLLFATLSQRMFHIQPVNVAQYIAGKKIM